MSTVSVRGRLKRNPTLRPSPSFPPPVFHIHGQRLETPEGKTSFEVISLHDDHDAAKDFLSDRCIIKPIRFLQRSSPRRFRVVQCSYETAMPDCRIKCSKRTKERQNKKYYAANDALPLPETYLDVPPSGSCSREFGIGDFMSRRAAFALAAARNAKAIRRFGREIKDARSDSWNVVVEVGQEVPCLHTVDVFRNGVGKESMSLDRPVRIVVPTDAERARHLIDWSRLAKRKAVAK